MLLKFDQKWDRLRAEAHKQNAQDVLKMMDAVERELTYDIISQEARFTSYLPARPVDYQHEDTCQIVRYGPDSCCTCKSNMERRRKQVENAAKARDLDFRETLGSMEAHAFDLVAYP